MIRYPKLFLWQIAVICPGLLSCFIFPTHSGNAQVIPDTTLGIESSQISPAGDRIDGGALRGSNLFHSFQQFDIEAGRSVYFNDRGAANIFSRVTGSASNINGTLGAYGNANLFLINPNGITFGQNARLDLGGSFVATTANSILFDKGGIFSASNPAASSILNIDASVQAPIGLQFEGVPKDILVSDDSIRIVNDKVLKDGFDLEVKPGKSISLVGGNITLKGGYLTTTRGQVSLGSVGSEGIVYFNPNDFNLDFSKVVQRAKIVLTNGSEVKTGGGDINILAKEVQVGKELAIGNQGEPPSGLYSTDTKKTQNANAGNIVINTGSLIVKDGGQISSSNFLEENKIKKIGNGSAGSISIIANDLVDVDGTSTVVNSPGIIPEKSLLLPSGIFAFTENEYSAGQIDISTDRLTVRNGASISTSTTSPGATKNGGNIIITGVKKPASYVEISGNSDESQGIGRGKMTPGMGNGSRIRTITTNNGNAGNVSITSKEVVIKGAARLDTRTTGNDGKSGDGTGNAGKITIESSSLKALSGGQIISITNSQGNAGEISIKATEQVLLDGQDEKFEARDKFINDKGRLNDGSSSGFITRAQDGSSGKSRSSNKGGDIIVTTPNLNILNEAILNAQTSSSRNGGDIQVYAKNITIQSGGQIITNTSGSGNAGSIYIKGDSNLKADSVSIKGSGLSTQRSSGLITDTKSSGRGGGITIDAENLNISDRAVLNSRTQKDGKGGQVNVVVTNLTANAGGQIITTTSGSQQAGNILVNVAKNLTLSGSVLPLLKNQDNVKDPINSQVYSGLFANTDEGSKGDGGGIFINSRLASKQNISPATRVIIEDKAKISVDSLGSGIGGNIEVNSQRVDLSNGKITSTTAFSNGGDIDLNIKNLLFMQNASQISTNAGTDESTIAQGSGGNIFINRNRQVPIDQDLKQGFIIAIPNQNNDITANSFSNQGGKVEISVQRIFGLTARSRVDLETWWKANHPGQELKATDLNPTDLQTSDITAISQGNASLNGTVAVSPSVDPNQGLNQTPQEPRSTEITDNCQVSNGKESVQFFDIGRGGLPPRPEDPLSIDLLEWVPTPTVLPSHSFPTDKASQTSSDRSSISFQPSNSTTPKLLSPCQSH